MQIETRAAPRWEWGRTIVEFSAGVRIGASGGPFPGGVSEASP
jgi:hypothetical protein